MSENRAPDAIRADQGLVANARCGGLATWGMLVAFLLMFVGSTWAPDDRALDLSRLDTPLTVATTGWIVLAAGGLVRVLMTRPVPWAEAVSGATAVVLLGVVQATVWAVERAAT